MLIYLNILNVEYQYLNLYWDCDQQTTQSYSCVLHQSEQRNRNEIMRSNSIINTKWKLLEGTGKLQPRMETISEIDWIKQWWLINCYTSLSYSFQIGMFRPFTISSHATIFLNITTTKAWTIIISIASTMTRNNWNHNITIDNHRDVNI